MEIQNIESQESDVLICKKQIVNILQDALCELKKFIHDYTFCHAKEEIRFFKELKPLLLSKIIYYNTIYIIELKIPNGSDEVQRQYINSELDRLTVFFERNLTFYQYYRNNSTYLDDKYFLRGRHDIETIVDNFYFETDPLFSTSHDFKVAKILANELLKIYLTNRLNEMDRDVQRKNCNPIPPEERLSWTGTKRSLVEFIYAVEASGDFNKGTADIKSIASYFENVFNVDLGDYYHIYMEIKGRKINQIRYLENLIRLLKKRMDEEND